MRRLLAVLVVLACPSTALAEAPACPPGDRTYPTQASLRAHQWGLDQIRAPAAWARGLRGQGVTVAVIDSGADHDHPDLRQGLVRGRSFLQGDPRPDCPDDGNGHGTHVAGIIGARDDGRGTTGVAPRVRLMPLKVGATTPQDPVVVPSALAPAIRWAVDHGADVITMSLAIDRANAPVVELLEGSFLAELDAAVTYAADRGVVVVAAAGNGAMGSRARQTGCTAPADHPRALCVSGTDRRGLPSRIQNLPTRELQEHGAVRAPGGAHLDQHPALVEPLGQCGPAAEEVMSTWPSGLGSPFCGPDYEVLAGSSMAAPHAAGLAALLVQCGLRGDEVVERITGTASGGGRWDPVMGFGVIDVDAATSGCR